MNSDPTTLGVVELAAAIRTRRISSREVVQAHLDRVDTIGSEVNAITQVRREQALAEAARADDATVDEDDLGPLHGVPFGLKENVDLAGWPTTDGVSAFADAVAEQYAPSVAHLRAAGAIVLGRTNLPDFALRWHTDSELHGPTRNPFDPTITPGGSSGGDAVAVATGMVPFSVGNDMGGSLRWPAQCNGVAAFKPSFGRVADARSLQPTEQPLSGQLMAVQGPLARQVDDLRVLLDVMSRPSARDPWHVPAVAAITPKAPIHVSLTIRPSGTPCAPEIERSLRWAGSVLAEAGYIVEEVEPPDPTALAQLWVRILMAALVPVWDEQLEPHCSSDTQTFIRDAMACFPLDSPEAQYASWMERQSLAREWSLFMERYPLVLIPVSTQPPFSIGADLQPGASETLVDTFRFLLPANVIGLPALSVPVRPVDGRPQSVQLIGRYLHDSMCLNAGSVLEQARRRIDPVEVEPAS